jgi:hypothetical protein
MALTPDGTKNNPVDPAELSECWINSTTTPELTALNASLGATYFQTLCIAACAFVNNYCNRKFNTQTIDQIYLNETFRGLSYKQFQVDNKPLTSVTKMWVDVAGTFSEVALTYMQIDTSLGVIKIIPDALSTILTSVPIVTMPNHVNIWIRYVSGYAVADIPKDLQMATALYLTYLYEQSKSDGSVESFSTQTYSQKNTGGKGSGKMMTIEALLKKYKYEPMYFA